MSLVKFKVEIQSDANRVFMKGDEQIGNGSKG